MSQLNSQAQPMVIKSQTMVSSKTDKIGYVYIDC